MADLLRGDQAHVNLIPMNPVAHTPWQASPMAGHRGVRATLRGGGIATTVRRNRGIERSARPAASSPPSGRASPPPRRVARRRGCSWRPSRAARRVGEARYPAQVGGESRGRPAGRGSRRASSTPTSATSTAWSDELERGRAGPHPPRRHGRPLRPEHHLRTEDHRGAPRRRTELPIDAHLMIDEPGRYIDRVPRRRPRPITFHVEVDEPIAPTILRPSGRRPGSRPRGQAGDPVAAVEPYARPARHRHDHDRRARLRRAAFMADVLREKAPGARRAASRLFGGEVHVDGGVNRETAEFAGALGVDVFVVGSALFRKGRDMGREVRPIRASQTRASSTRLNAPSRRPGRPDQPLRLAAKHLAHRLMAARGDGFGDDAAGGRADQPGRRPRLRPADPPRSSASSVARTDPRRLSSRQMAGAVVRGGDDGPRALLHRGVLSSASVPVRGRGARRRSAPGSSCCWGRSGDDRAIADALARPVTRVAHLPRRGGADQSVAARCRR